MGQQATVPLDVQEVFRIKWDGSSWHRHIFIQRTTVTDICFYGKGHRFGLEVDVFLIKKNKKKKWKNYIYYKSHFTHLMYTLF